MKVCFVALNAYPAIDPTADCAVGGLEMGVWRLARRFAKCEDVEVSMLVRHTHAARCNVVEKVEIHVIVDQLRDIRHNVSKFLRREVGQTRQHLRDTPRLIWQIPLLIATRAFRDRRPIAARIEEQLHQIRPDVCVVSGTGSDQAAVVRTCKSISCRTMLCLVSNSDVRPEIFVDAESLNAYGESAKDCLYALKNASQVVCQTSWQRSQVACWVQRESSILNYPVDLERWSPAATRQFPTKKVLWIGRYDRWHKRPELCLKVAQRCPELRFLMIINRGEPSVERKIRRTLPPNVQIIDYVPNDQMPQMYWSALALLSTGSSEYEGFPNVFLEASAAGTPIVSLEDFDDFLHDSGAGTIANGSVDRAADALHRLSESESLWRQHSEAAAHWVGAHHAADRVAVRFAQLVQECLDGTPDV